jgi:hypothetical protein
MTFPYLIKGAHKALTAKKVAEILAEQDADQDPAGTAKKLEAETRCNMWLADGNAAKEAGNARKAQRCYEKSQYWLDKYNRLTGRA